MKIGITGTSGFIGASLLASLQSSTAINLRESSYENNNLNVIIHCANDHFSIQNNLELTNKIFNIAKKQKSIKVIYILLSFSTLTSGTENYSKFNLGFTPKYKDDYSHGKLMQEKYCIYLSEKMQIPVVFVYLPAVFGNTGAWYDIYRQINFAKSIVIPENPAFNFCHINDISEFINHDINQDHRHELLIRREVINSTLSQHTSIQSLIKETEGKSITKTRPSLKQKIILNLLFRHKTSRSILSVIRRLRKKEKSNKAENMDYFKFSPFYFYLLHSQKYIQPTYSSKFDISLFNERIVK